MNPLTRISFDLPPNYDALVECFGELSEDTVFAYGNTIYAPSAADRKLPDHLIAHEETHFRQQAEAGGPDAWWQRYMDDPDFRLEQELEAYRVQLATIEDRAERRRVKAVVAKHLASRLYGKLVTKEKARRLLSGPLA